MDSAEYSARKSQMSSSTNPLDRALMYQIYDDTAAADLAIAEIVAYDYLNNEVPPTYDSYHQSHILRFLLLYDWLYDRMTVGERATVKTMIHHRIGLSEYTYQQAAPVTYPFVGGGDFRDNYVSNVNGAYDSGPFETMAALCLADEEQWARDCLMNCYQTHEGWYSPFFGGALATLSLLSNGSGGGTQAGLDPQLGSGYNGTLTIGLIIACIAWETALGDDLLSQTDFIDKYVEHAAIEYADIGECDDEAKQLIEWICSLGTTQDVRDKARWLRTHFGEPTYGRGYAHLIGDFRGSSTAPDAVVVGQDERCGVGLQPNRIHGDGRCVLHARAALQRVP